MRRMAVHFAAACVALLPAVALADPPPANFTLEFDGDAAIWNPFDDFSACETAFGLTLCLDLDAVACAANGRCAGNATWDLSGFVDGQSLEGVLGGPFTAQTKCKASGDPTKPVCKAKIDGCETDGELTIGALPPLDAEIKGCSIKGTVSNAGSFDAFGKAKICVDGFGCDTVGGEFDYDVNPPTAWMLMVELTATEKGFSATATDTLGFEYVGKAKYSEKSDSTKLSLKGAVETKDDEDKGAKVGVKGLTASGATITGGEAKFSVQGNKGTASFD
ncbi:MAG: hypothetical protein ABFS41_12910 [Myxococcota bacterium]